MSRRREIAFAGLLVTFGLARPTLAQPMMIDPSRMSGIPRPDSQVPGGTITVRLIRGELANRLTNVEVELKDASGNAKKEKTNDEGRATFSGLSGGPFIAHAVIGEESLESQPIELPSGVGVRVMLVFKRVGERGGAERSGAGSLEPSQGSKEKSGATSTPGEKETAAAATPPAADGVGRPDKSVPPGTILVRVTGDGGAPLPQLEVVLGHARAGEEGVKETKGKTDDKGEARFTGLDAKPTSGYLVRAIRDGAQFAGKPFRLSDNMGAMVWLEVRAVTKDVSGLSMGNGSHFIFEVQDDAVQVGQLWRLTNSGTSPVDVGPGGLHFSLPAKALSVQAGRDVPPNFTAAGHEAVWKGPIPPGTINLQVGFVLTYDGTSLSFEQKTPVPFADLAIVTERIDGYSIEGNGLQREDRELGGRKLVVLRGEGTQPGGSVTLQLVGLPRGNPFWRYMTAAATVGILMVFAFFAFSSPGQSLSHRRRMLERDREKLMADLAGLPERGQDSRADKKRKDLTEKLTKVYRDLDNFS